MPGFFDNQSIDIPCPKCGKKHPKTTGWLKANNHIVCGCGARINLETSGLKSGLASADRSLDDLRRTLRNFGR